MGKLLFVTFWNIFGTENYYFFLMDSQIQTLFLSYRATIFIYYFLEIGSPLKNDADKNLVVLTEIIWFSYALVITACRVKVSFLLTRREKSECSVDSQWVEFSANTFLASGPWWHTRSHGMVCFKWASMWWWSLFLLFTGHITSSEPHLDLNLQWPKQ